MTLVSLADCCRWLAIDPKTLRHWMSLSRLFAQPHPLDARCKCLTREQVQQLAATHRRTLPTEQERPFQPETTLLSTPTSVKSEPVLPEDSALISSLLQQLASLQAHVATLQHQFAQFTDQWSMSQSGPTTEVLMRSRPSLQSSQDKSLDSSQEKSWQSSQDKSLDSSQEKSWQSSQDKSLDSSQEKSLRPPKEKAVKGAGTDRRSRHQVLPLVEYCSEARYVVICPKLGLLDFVPDSASWFAWLSTLSSFHFVGASGHLTVHRNGCSPRWTWRATRSIHSRSRSLHLVRTEFLTIAVLEQAAASLQSLLN